MIKIKFYKKKSLFIGCCVIKAAGRQQAMHHGRATTLEGMSKDGSKTENTNPVGLGTDLCVHGPVVRICVFTGTKNAGEANERGTSYFP